MAIWDDVITERDRLVFESSGFGQQRIGFGQKPALVIIDVNNNIVGDKPEPILESIKRYPFSCGEEGWKAVHQIASLLPLVREKHIPIIYITSGLGPRPKGWINLKCSRIKEVANIPAAMEIVEEIAPLEEDIVICKPRSNAFYGTPLLSTLNALQADTLLVCGAVTSGCVRATVVDAMHHNFRVAVIEECTFDRAEVSHKISLFDMNAKCADVVSISEIRDYISRL